MAVTLMVTTITKSTSSCVIRFLQPTESIKSVVRVGFPEGVGLAGKLPFPCLPSLSSGEFRSAGLSGVLDHGNRTGEGICNRIFSSNQESGWFAETAFALAALCLSLEACLSLCMDASTGHVHNSRDLFHCKNKPFFGSQWPVLDAKPKEGKDSV